MARKHLFHSTNLKAPGITFKEALLKGLAPDGGLYYPAGLPEITRDELRSFSSMDYPSIASFVLSRLVGDGPDENEMETICREIYTFKVPLERVYGRNYIMRLDQGPTASFKDFAALFMGRMMQHFLSIEGKHLTILTATSGDTGSAVANAFYGLENINVVILFPAGEVSEMQRKQMTTLHRNISIIEIDGKFDDCQNLVKRAFMDPDLTRLRLSSANSINVGRLLPQSVYYFWAWSRLSVKSDEQAVFSVPCGNFGNLAGGLIAREMGLPVKTFIIATNENDEVPRFLETGRYNAIKPSRNCISSAMNVGHPSNLARIITLYRGSMDEKGTIVKPPDLVRMRRDFFSVSVSDQETRETILQCYRQFRLLLEPHGAVAWKGLMAFLKQQPEYLSEKFLSISLETAHPAKFGEEIRKVVNILPVTPDSLLKIEGKKEEYISLGNNYEVFKSYLINNY